MKLADRMKSYENKDRVDTSLPIIVRLDGKNFSSFTRDLEKPFDSRLMEVFRASSKEFLEQTQGNLIYHQSDEISLYFKDGILFDGKIQKLTSVFSSILTNIFSTHLDFYLPNKKRAVFDCRVFNLPNIDEVANYFYWREEDCFKNAVSAISYKYFSKNSLLNVNTKQKIEKLSNLGVNIYSYSRYCLQGSYFHKIEKEIKYTKEELDQLPIKHEARINPELTVKRKIVEEFSIPRLKYCNNKKSALHL